MAYTPQPADILQITWVIVNAEQVAMPRLMLFVNSIGGGGGVTQQQIAAAYGLPFFTNVNTTMNSDSNLHGTICQRILPTQRIAYEFSTTSSGAGTLAGGATMPRQTAGIIRFGTSLAGRRFRGRLYLPFPGTNVNTTGGVPTAGYITACQVFANFISSAQSVIVGALQTNLSPILLTRSTGNFATILTGTVLGKWATVRRRGSYGRPNVAPF